MILVLNTQEFLNRVWQLRKLEIFSGKGQTVDTSIDAAYTGRLDDSGTSKRFAHQREYRIAIDSPGDDPFVLDIGDINRHNF